MLHFRKLLLLLLAIIASGTCPCRAVNIYYAPEYNLDSLCYISTDAVEVSLVRHQNTRDYIGDTFTATVLNTLGGDYKPGDKIKLPYNQIALPPQHSCSHCILFVARKDFQLDLENAKSIPPQINEVLPVDELGRIQRYLQWVCPPGTLSPEAENAAEQNHPELAEECQLIRSRWSAVGSIRPLLAHALRQEDVPHLLNMNRQRLLSRETSLGMEDVIDDLVNASVVDLHDSASHQSEKLASDIRLVGILRHVICGH